MALAVAALVGAALLPWRDDGAPIAPATAEQALASPPSGAVGDPAPAPAAERAPERAEVSAQSPPVTAAAELAHVRGRCVDEAGAPLAGCVAELRGAGPFSAALQGADPWEAAKKTPQLRMKPTTTGADGHFEFAFAPPTGMQFDLDLRRDGRMPERTRWRQLQPGQVVDLGDVRMGRGFELRGRVVDEHGAPAADVAVLILTTAAGGALDVLARATSEADGTFVGRELLPVGTWAVTCPSPGWLRLAPAMLVVTERGAPPLEVVVRRLPSIAGVVVDNLGEPVAGVELSPPVGRDGAAGRVRTGADGTFILHATDDSPTVQLRVTDAGRCQLPAEPDLRAWPWGTRDVRIELRRALVCDLVVVERGSGAPVEGFAVRCGDPRQQHGSVRLDGTHPGGRVAIDGIGAGANVLQVVPHDPALLPNEPVTFVATPSGVPPQRIELERMLPATVRVLRVDGTPIAGTKVEIVAKGTRPFDVGAPLVDRRGGIPGSDPLTGGAPHRRIHEATTDANGRAAVLVLAAPQPLAVRATGDHLPAIVDPAVFVPDDELRIVPSNHGTIAGVVRVRRLDAACLRVAAIDPRTFIERGAAAVRPDGGFATSPLPPGRYRIRVTYATTPARQNDGAARDAPLDLPPTEIDVHPDDVAHVELDATTLDPAHLRGRVLVDGLPHGAASVHLLSRGGGIWSQYVCDANGEFTAPDLLPDTYRVLMRTTSAAFPFTPGMPAEGDFRVAAGERLEATFSFVRRRLVVTVSRPDGTPAANVHCRAIDPWFRTTTTVAGVTTDAAGRAVFDPAPATSLTIEANGSRIDVQIPPGATTHDVALTLPQ